MVPGAARPERGYLTRPLFSCLNSRGLQLGTFKDTKEKNPNCLGFKQAYFNFLLYFLTSQKDGYQIFERFLGFCLPDPEEGLRTFGSAATTKKKRLWRGAYGKWHARGDSNA